MTDIEELEQLPNKVSMRRSHRDLWSRWYNSDWGSYTNNLSRVKLWKMIGKPLKVITDKYLHRLPNYYDHYRSNGKKVDRLLALLDVYVAIKDENGNISIVDSYRGLRTIKGVVKDRGFYYRRINGIFYIHPDTQCLCFAGKKPRKIAKAEKLKRRVEAAEAIRQSRKQARLRKKARLEKVYSFVSEKEKQEKARDLVKIISHGFDPETSFRNVPLT